MTHDYSGAAAVAGHRVLEEEKAWSDIATEVLGGEPDLVFASPSIPDSRIYRREGRAAKIRSRETLPRGLRPLSEQAQLLRKAGLDVEYSNRGKWDVLTMPWYEGTSLASDEVLPFPQRLRVARGVLSELSRLHKAGVAHGDVHPNNILVTKDGVKLLDYDSASEGKGMGLWSAEMRSRTFPLWRLMVSLVVPGARAVRERLQALRSKGRVRPAAHKPASAAPAAGAQDDISLLRQAWSLASLSDDGVSEAKAYYALTYKGVHLPGDRPWCLRWEPIRRSVDFKNKRLVELGCNSGLLSSYAMIHGATSATGADYDAQLVESAKHVARALKSGAEFHRVDVAADPGWEEKLGTGDIATALSLVQWLAPDAQERVLRFLGRHREVLYEGHDPLEVEMNRLRKVGFTDIKVLANTERERVLLHARR